MLYVTARVAVVTQRDYAVKSYSLVLLSITHTETAPVELEKDIKQTVYP